MTLQDWLVFAGVSVLPALSPGPALVLALSNSLRFTPRATVWSSLGNSIGLLGLGMAVVFGLAGLVAASATAFSIVKLVGAGYLVFLGVRLWRGEAGASPTARAPRRSARPRRLFGEGLLVAITNPKAIVILLALLPPFLEPGGNLMLQALILSLTYSLLCYANHMLVAVCAGRLGRVLQSERGGRVFRRSIGTLFIVLGAALTQTAPP